MAAIVLLSETILIAGTYETPVYTAPTNLDGSGNIIPGMDDPRSLKILFTRNGWPLDVPCLEVKIWVNYHADTPKWTYLIGFVANGNPPKSGTLGLPCGCGRKIKPERFRQIKAEVTIFRTVTTEISVEFS